MDKIPHDPDEILAIVDDNDAVVGEASRREVHEKGLLHREVYVHLLNSKKQLLLHRRKDNGLWDHSSSGHFPRDQGYLEAAQREFEEELGVILGQDEFTEIAFAKLKRVKPTKINYRFAKTYLVRRDIALEDFRIDTEEIAEIRYFDRHALKELLAVPEKIMTGSVKKIIQDYIIEKFM
jgi:isopentenyldiphosphate isomerase